MGKWRNNLGRVGADDAGGCIAGITGGTLRPCSSVPSMRHTRVRNAGVVALVAIILLGLVAPSYAAKPKVIRWSHPALIQTMSDAKHHLRGTPRGLKKAVVRQAQKLLHDAYPCEYPEGANVQVYAASGYARGDIGGCGGAVAFWTDFGNGKRHGGTWRLVLATQEATTCRFAKRYKMPSSIVGTTCYNQARTKGHPYHQR